MYEFSETELWGLKVYLLSWMKKKMAGSTI